MTATVSKRVTTAALKHDATRGLLMWLADESETDREFTVQIEARRGIGLLAPVWDAVEDGAPVAPEVLAHCLEHAGVGLNAYAWVIRNAMLHQIDASGTRTEFAMVEAPGTTSTRAARNKGVPVTIPALSKLLGHLGALPLAAVRATYSVNTSRNAHRTVYVNVAVRANNATHALLGTAGTVDAEVKAARALATKRADARAHAEARVRVKYQKPIWTAEAQRQDARRSLEALMRRIGGSSFADELTAWDATDAEAALTGMEAAGDRLLRATKAQKDLIMKRNAEIETAQAAAVEGLA